MAYIARPFADNLGTLEGMCSATKLKVGLVALTQLFKHWVQVSAVLPPATDIRSEASE